MSNKIIRITTSPLALKYLLPGQMQFMQKHGFEVIMISADGKERDEIIKNEGCKHIVVPMTRQITPWQDLKCLWQLIKIFRKEKPKIVHTHTPKAGLLGMLAAYICSVKVRIHTVAGLPLMVEKGFKFRLLTLIEKITYAAANRVWPNSTSLKNYIIEKRFTKKSKLGVILMGSSNGINLNRYSKQSLDNNIIEEIKKSFFYSEKNKYLLFVGRMVADKGITELVDAFSILQKNQNWLKLILVGPFEKELDPLPSNTLKQIESNPAIFHINWTDYVEYYMALAHYFVFPSHREGFPNVLLQAGAMELPIICSNIPGNIDIVVNNETGITFEKQNSKDLMNAIFSAIKKPLESQKMANDLKKFIYANYDQEVIWRELLNKYNELIVELE
ncbi:MAG TPA: glycosyltransferase family 4 protein [Hanamia sp.]